MFNHNSQINQQKIVLQLLGNYYGLWPSNESPANWQLNVFEHVCLQTEFLQVSQNVQYILINFFISKTLIITFLICFQGMKTVVVVNLIGFLFLQADPFY